MPAPVPAPAPPAERDVVALSVASAQPAESKDVVEAEVIDLTGDDDPMVKAQEDLFAAVREMWLTEELKRLTAKVATLDQHFTEVTQLLDASKEREALVTERFAKALASQEKLEAELAEKEKRCEELTRELQALKGDGVNLQRNINTALNRAKGGTKDGRPSPAALAKKLHEELSALRAKLQMGKGQ